MELKHAGWLCHHMLLHPRRDNSGVPGMRSTSADSAVPVVPVVSPCAHLVAGVLSDANLGVCSRLLPQQCALHVHTPTAHPPHTATPSLFQTIWG